MQFNKTVRQPNTNYDTEVANKEEAIKIINEIDKYLDYVDDVSEYDQIKKYVQTYEPTEYNEMQLTEESQRVLQSKFDRLKELADTLK